MPMYRNVTTTPVPRLRSRSSRGGSSGSRLRRSIAANAPSRAKPAPAPRAQPGSGPSTRANTTSVVPDVAVSAPAQVEPAAGLPRRIRRQQGERERGGGRGRRDVHEEHRRPAERLRQHATQQGPQCSAAGRATCSARGGSSHSRPGPVRAWAGRCSSRRP
ncbi:hypothetical protein [Amycolatopsis sp. CA-128772]|uniref:hypothetical protein n=1 Tax=Amycolatopsis sp. CA-128772 TaxID=2073159 RepID=UPI0011B0148D|nr:hypothetical protein [Amycolatopsis sp. CA-128772]